MSYTDLPLLDRVLLHMLVLYIDYAVLGKKLSFNIKSNRDRVVLLIWCAI